MVGERASREASLLLFIFGHGGSEAEAVAVATRSADYTADVEARITTIDSYITRQTTINTKITLFTGRTTMKKKSTNQAELNDYLFEASNNSTPFRGGIPLSPSPLMG